MTRTLMPCGRPMTLGRPSRPECSCRIPRGGDGLLRNVSYRPDVLKPNSSTPMKVKPKCCEYGCSVCDGGNGASLIVWQESTATGFRSIADFESVLIVSGVWIVASVLIVSGVWIVASVLIVSGVWIVASVLIVSGVWIVASVLIVSGVWIVEVISLSIGGLPGSPPMSNE